MCALPCRRPSHPSRSVVTAIGALARLLRDRKVRLLFQKSAGVQLLAPLLRQSSQSGPSNQQLLYEAGLCVWQLTFLPEATSVMGSSGIVQGLVEMARSAQKEKVRLPAAFAVAWPAICLSWLSNKCYLVLKQEAPAMRCNQHACLPSLALAKSSAVTCAAGSSPLCRFGDLNYGQASTATCCPSALVDGPAAVCPPTAAAACSCSIFASDGTS